MFVFCLFFYIVGPVLFLSVFVFCSFCVCSCIVGFVFVIAFEFCLRF